MWTKFFEFLMVLLLMGCGHKVKESETITLEQTKPVPTIPEIPLKQSTQRVALLVPLTGEHENLGKSLKNAAELSLFTHANDHFDLIIQDTQGTEKGAVQAIQKVLAQDVQLILGPVFAYEVQSVQPYMSRKKIPMIVFSSDQTVMRPNVYVMGFSPRAQVKRIVSFAKSQGIDRLVALIPSNPYGQLVEQELKSLEKSKETTLVKIISYKGNGENLEEELNLLKNQSYNGLLLPVAGEELKLLLSNLRAFGFDMRGIQLLGTGLWDSLDTYAVEELQNGWYAGVSPTQRLSFETRYRENYGVLPTRISTLAYDAVSLATTLSDTATQNSYRLDQLTQRQGFLGTDGLFRLKSEGSVERALAILKITPQGSQLLEAAQSQF